VQKKTENVKHRWFKWKRSVFNIAIQTPNYLL